MKIVRLLLIVSFIVGARAQECEKALTPLKSIPLPGVEGRIDHMDADVAGKRVFIAALGNNSVEVVDLTSGVRTQSLLGFQEPQGIAYVPECDRLFVANGGDGTCRILDGHSFKTIASIAVGDDADNVRYDPKSRKVYIGYGNGGLAVLDAKSGKRLEDIHLAGHPEAFQMEKGGSRLFVNIPTSFKVTVVDREKKEVIQSWIPKGSMNFPMTLDEKNHRLFVGCRLPAKVLVYDSNTGRQIASVPIGADTDDLYYDPSTKLLYASCGGGTVDVIEQTALDTYQKINSNQSALGARTSLFIPELKSLCVAVPHRGSQTSELRVFKTQ